MKLGLKPKKVVTINVETSVTCEEFAKHGPVKVADVIQSKLFAAIVDQLRVQDLIKIESKPGKDCVVFTAEVQVVKALKEHSCQLN